ncbi:MAG: hypothetical protein ACOH2H_20850 [Cypionkella sp.]
MISDLPGSARLAYAGTDHCKAGRSAGYFLGLMVPPAPLSFCATIWDFIPIPRVCTA